MIPISRVLPPEGEATPAAAFRLNAEAMPAEPLRLKSEPRPLGLDARSRLLELQALPHLVASAFRRKGFCTENRIRRLDVRCYGQVSRRRRYTL